MGFGLVSKAKPVATQPLTHCKHFGEGVRGLQGVALEFFAHSVDHFSWLPNDQG